MLSIDMKQVQKKKSVQTYFMVNIFLKNMRAFFVRNVGSRYFGVPGEARSRISFLIKARQN